MINLLDFVQVFGSQRIHDLLSFLSAVRNKMCIFFNFTLQFQLGLSKSLLSPTEILSQ